MKPVPDTLVLTKRGYGKVCVWDTKTTKIYFDNSEKANHISSSVSYSLTMNELLACNKRALREWNTGAQLEAVLPWIKDTVNNFQDLEPIATTR